MNLGGQNSSLTSSESSVFQDWSRKTSNIIDFTSKYKNIRRIERKIDIRRKWIGCARKLTHKTRMEIDRRSVTLTRNYNQLLELRLYYLFCFWIQKSRWKRFARILMQRKLTHVYTEFAKEIQIIKREIRLNSWKKLYYNVTRSVKIDKFIEEYAIIENLRVTKFYFNEWKESYEILSLHREKYRSLWIHLCSGINHKHMKINLPSTINFIRCKDQWMNMLFQLHLCALKRENERNVQRRKWHRFLNEYTYQMSNSEMLRIGFVISLRRKWKVFIKDVMFNHTIKMIRKSKALNDNIMLLKYLSSKYMTFCSIQRLKGAKDDYKNILEMSIRYEVTKKYFTKWRKTARSDKLISQLVKKSFNKSFAVYKHIYRDNAAMIIQKCYLEHVRRHNIRRFLLTKTFYTWRNIPFKLLMSSIDTIKDLFLFDFKPDIQLGLDFAVKVPHPKRLISLKNIAQSRHKYHHYLVKRTADILSDEIFLGIPVDIFGAPLYVFDLIARKTKDRQLTESKYEEKSHVVASNYARFDLCGLNLYDVVNFRVSPLSDFFKKIELPEFSSNDYNNIVLSELKHISSNLELEMQSGKSPFNTDLISTQYLPDFASQDFNRVIMFIETQVSVSFMHANIIIPFSSAFYRYRKLQRSVDTMSVEMSVFYVPDFNYFKSINIKPLEYFPAKYTPIASFTDQFLEDATSLISLSHKVLLDFGSRAQSLTQYKKFSCDFYGGTVPYIASHRILLEKAHNELTKILFKRYRPLLSLHPNVEINFDYPNVYEILSDVFNIRISMFNTNIINFMYYRVKQPIVHKKRLYSLTYDFTRICHVKDIARPLEQFRPNSFGEVYLQKISRKIVNSYIPLISNILPVINYDILIPRGQVMKIFMGGKIEEVSHNLILDFADLDISTLRVFLRYYKYNIFYQILSGCIGFPGFNFIYTNPLLRFVTRSCPNYRFDDENMFNFNFPKHELPFLVVKPIANMRLSEYISHRLAHAKYAIYDFRAPNYSFISNIFSKCSLIRQMPDFEPVVNLISENIIVNLWIPDLSSGRRSITHFKREEFPEWVSVLYEDFSKEHFYSLDQTVAFYTLFDQIVALPKLRCVKIERAYEVPKIYENQYLGNLFLDCVFTLPDVKFSNDKYLNISLDERDAESVKKEICFDIDWTDIVKTQKIWLRQPELPYLFRFINDVFSFDEEFMFNFDPMLNIGKIQLIFHEVEEMFSSSPDIIKLQKRIEFDAPKLAIKHLIPRVSIEEIRLSQSEFSKYDFDIPSLNDIVPRAVFRKRVNWYGYKLNPRILDYQYTYVIDLEDIPTVITVLRPLVSIIPNPFLDHVVDNSIKGCLDTIPLRNDFLVNLQRGTKCLFDYKEREGPTYECDLSSISYDIQFDNTKIVDGLRYISFEAPSPEDPIELPCQYSDFTLRDIKSVNKDVLMRLTCIQSPDFSTKLEVVKSIKINLFIPEALSRIPRDTQFQCLSHQNYPKHSDPSKVQPHTHMPRFSGLMFIGSIMRNISRLTSVPGVTVSREIKRRLVNEASQQWFELDFDFSLPIESLFHLIPSVRLPDKRAIEVSSDIYINVHIPRPQISLNGLKQFLAPRGQFDTLNCYQEILYQPDLNVKFSIFSACPIKYVTMMPKMLTTNEMVDLHLDDFSIPLGRSIQGLSKQKIFRFTGKVQLPDPHFFNDVTKYGTFVHVKPVVKAITHFLRFSTRHIPSPAKMVDEIPHSEIWNPVLELNDCSIENIVAELYYLPKAEIPDNPFIREDLKMRLDVADSEFLYMLSDSLPTLAGLAPDRCRFMTQRRIKVEKAMRMLKLDLLEDMNDFFEIHVEKPIKKEIMNIVESTDFIDTLKEISFSFEDLIIDQIVSVITYTAKDIASGHYTYPNVAATLISEKIIEDTMVNIQEEMKVIFRPNDIDIPYPEPIGVVDNIKPLARSINSTLDDLIHSITEKTLLDIVEIRSNHSKDIAKSDDKLKPFYVSLGGMRRPLRIVQKMVERAREDPIPVSLLLLEQQTAAKDGDIYTTTNTVINDTFAADNTIIDDIFSDGTEPPRNELPDNMRIFHDMGRFPSHHNKQMQRDSLVSNLSHTESVVNITDKTEMNISVKGDDPLESSINTECARSINTSEGTSSHTTRDSLDNLTFSSEITHQVIYSTDNLAKSPSELPTVTSTSDTLDVIFEKVESSGPRRKHRLDFVLEFFNNNEDDLLRCVSIAPIYKALSLDYRPKRVRRSRVKYQDHIQPVKSFVDAALGNLTGNSAVSPFTNILDMSFNEHHSRSLFGSRQNSSQTLPVVNFLDRSLHSCLDQVVLLSICKSLSVSFFVDKSGRNRIDLTRVLNHIEESLDDSVRSTSMISVFKNSRLI